MVTPFTTATSDVPSREPTGALLDDPVRQSATTQPLPTVNLHHVLRLYSIFAQPDPAREQLEKVACALEQKLPRVGQLLREAEDEVLAYMAFPPSHWRQLHSTNTLERGNREIGRRTDVVGSSPMRRQPYG